MGRGPGELPNCHTVGWAGSLCSHLEERQAWQVTLSPQVQASLFSKHAVRSPSPVGTYFLGCTNTRCTKPSPGQRPHFQPHEMRESPCHPSKTA